MITFLCQPRWTQTILGTVIVPPAINAGTRSASPACTNRRKYVYDDIGTPSTLMETSDLFLLYNNLFIYQVLCTLIYRRRSLYSFLMDLCEGNNRPITTLCKKLITFDIKRSPKDSRYGLIYVNSMSNMGSKFAFLYWVRSDRVSERLGTVFYVFFVCEIRLGITNQ